MCSPRGVVVALLLAGSIACREQTGEREVPATLLGVWETEHPRYADRFFELTADQTIRFGQGEAGVSVSAVTAVETELDGTSGLIFHITHLNEAGEPYTLSLRYDPARGDELRLIHQPFVAWKRSPGSSTRPR